MHRAVSAIAAAAAVTTLAAGCSGPIDLASGTDRPGGALFGPGLDFTDVVQRAYATAEQHQLQVAAITQEHWSRLENSTGDIAKQVQSASAPGNRFFAQVFRAISRTRNPATQRFRAGMTNNCSYFPVGTATDSEHTVAVARICLDHDGRIFGTWWRVIDP
jgi:hypothetical protein